MSENPYQSPEVMDPFRGGHGADPTLDSAVDMLRQTKPWVRFISVMMFILSGFMVLAGLGIMVAGMAGGMAGGGAGPAPGIGMGIIGVVYIVMALLYIIPAVFLWKYADRIALLMQERSTGALAHALEAQKSFWKFVGIVMLIVIVVYALIFIFGIVVGVLGAVG